MADQKTAPLAVEIQNDVDIFPTPDDRLILRVHAEKQQVYRPASRNREAGL